MSKMNKYRIIKQSDIVSSLSHHERGSTTMTEISVDIPDFSYGALDK